MRGRHHSPIDRKAPPPRLTWSGLREAACLLAYLLPYLRKFLAANLCLLVSSLAGLAFPFFTGRLIDGASRTDCIYVIKAGEVVESGTHDELVARPDGVYRTLSELQFDLGEPEGASR
jgi:ABC-type multidrug transport system fused ATPase/permease subunit